MENTSGKKPVWKRWWFLAVAVLIMFVAVLIMFVVVASNGSSGTGNTQITTPAAEPIVDAPHLLGLTIEQAREELGLPDEKEFVDPTAQQISLGITTWTNQFTIGTHTIVLEYDVKTRGIFNFFIDTDDSSGATSDWKNLVQISGLSEQSSDYTIKPVEARKSPGKYTGVRADEVKK